MTMTLRANPRMVAGVAKRQMADRAAAIRSRVEGAGATGQMAKLSRAESKIHLGELPEAGELLLQIETALNERREASEVEAGLAESERLAHARGEDTARVENGPTRDGFLWLVAKGRLTPHRRIAGERYRQLYARANGGPTPSCLNEAMGGGGGDGPQGGTMIAVDELAKAHGHIVGALGKVSGATLIRVVQDVCGRGVTCRQLASDDKVRAAVIERELMTGLDMLARHWRMT